MKLVKKFRLRHTFEICYGEENSANKFKRGKRNQTLVKIYSPGSEYYVSDSQSDDSAILPCNQSKKIKNKQDFLESKISYILKRKFLLFDRISQTSFQHKIYKKSR